MPVPFQSIGSTAPKSGTYQFSQSRQQGLPFVIPAAAGVSSVSNRRIVSVQEDSNGNRIAVLGAVAESYYTIIGYGVLEEALQSGGINSIAPTPNTFVDGDTVTVLNYQNDAYMIDYDDSNVPTIGIASCRVDREGRLTSLGANGARIQLNGSVYASVPGLQMSGQLAQYTYFYTFRDVVSP